ncbi:MAG: alpha/beta hydrolase [Sinobacteraceae bacterium]|nr:alpha/beta hydrolase [Nevskiaceae bacterium]
MTSPLRSTLTTADGEQIACFDWAVPAARGLLLIVHGLGEHALRYARLAVWLNARGYAVRAYDQYGHGASSGRRGHLARDLQLIEHLAEIATRTRESLPEGQPLVVLGHSLGGLVVASAAERGLLPVQGLVLSSPALAVDMAAWQRVAVRWLPRYWPNLTLGNGLQPRYLSHDDVVVSAYQNDPLVHNRICARLGGFVASEGERVIEAAPGWTLRTALLYAGDDRLVSPRGSRAFAAAAPTRFVSSQCFDGLYHEIFNEPDEAPLKALEAWLNGAG